MVPLYKRKRVTDAAAKPKSRSLSRQGASSSVVQLVAIPVSNGENRRPPVYDGIGPSPPPLSKNKKLDAEKMTFPELHQEVQKVRSKRHARQLSPDSKIFLKEVDRLKDAHDRAMYFDSECNRVGVMLARNKQRARKVMAPALAARKAIQRAENDRALQNQGSTAFFEGKAVPEAGLALRRIPVQEPVANESYLTRLAEDAQIRSNAAAISPGKKVFRMDTGMLIRRDAEKQIVGARLDEFYDLEQHRAQRDLSWEKETLRAQRSFADYLNASN